MLKTLTITALLLAGGAQAATLTLHATPGTVAWGWYDAKGKPVLTIQPGDTVVIDTMLTNSTTGLEKNGIKPGDVQQSLRYVYDQVKDNGPGGHILTGPIAVA